MSHKCVYGCMFCILLFNMYFYCYVYVFLLLCMFCSVYSFFVVTTVTLRPPWLKFFRALSSVVSCMFCILLFNMYICCYVYVFLLLCMFCSVYSVFIVPTGTLRPPWLRFFRALSSVVRQMPGYNSQRRSTARTLPKWGIIFTQLVHR